MTFVHYAVVDRVAEIALARAPVNALTVPMLDDLIACLDRAGADDDVRAVILRSALPDRFCAGIDLRAVGTMPEDTLRTLIETLYLGLYDAQTRLGKPSIAAMHGAARGGGMTLAISCDLIVASRGASFGYPEIDIGVIPAIHFAHLEPIVGRYRAFDLLFTARSFDAQEAQRIGLVSSVVDDDALLAHARALAQTLAAKPPRALRFGRAAFRREVDEGYRERIARAVENFCAVASGDEAKRAIAAFLRRAPS